MWCDVISDLCRFYLPMLSAVLTEWDELELMCGQPAPALRIVEMVKLRLWHSRLGVG